MSHYMPTNGGNSNNSNKALIAKQQARADAHFEAERMVDVHKKMSLLELERKQTFESNTAAVKKNKTTISDLKKENKELKSLIIAARKGKNSGGSGAAAAATANGGNLGRGNSGLGPASIHDLELKHSDRIIFTTTLELDEAKDKEATLREELFNLRETRRELELNSQPILTEDSFLTRKIQILENRLDNSLIKYNEAAAIEKTYEQIGKRLKDERIGFDKQLAAIERALKAKDNDYRELLKMSHAANHAKEEAKRELQKFKQSFDEQRRAKDRELLAKKKYVQRKVKHTQELEVREKQKRDEIAQHERRLQDQKEAAANERGQLQHREGERSAIDEERASRFEAAFAKIADATGVRHVGELPHRLVMQEETHSQLRTMSQDVHSRIDQLKREITEMHSKVDSFRYAVGGTGQHGSRRIIEEFEVHLIEARNQRKHSQERYEMLTKLLIDLRAGTEHLVEKLSAFTSVAGGTEKNSSTDTNNNKKISDTSMSSVAVVTEENVVEALRLCEAKLVELSKELRERGGSWVDGDGSESGGGNTSRPATAAVRPGTTSRGSRNTSRSASRAGDDYTTNTIYEDYYQKNPEILQQIELPGYNQRVRLTTAAENEQEIENNNSGKVPGTNVDGGAGGGDTNHSGGGLGMLGDDSDDNAVLKRHQVKKISANSIQRETKKLRRRNKDR